MTTFPGFPVLAPRAERLDALSRLTFDVLVVGGGITGAASARDAASRGLSVAIVEKDDWASGTSWRSSKLVHGGLRYLRSGELGLVFESLAERARLLRLAPHLVSPLEFLFALLPGRWVSPTMLGAGLTLYDALSLGRRVPRHRSLSPGEALDAEPLLAGSGISGGALYWDASADDARLTLENVLDAASLGAIAVSRAAVESFRRGADGRIAGAAVRDVETGRVVDVRARVTVQATGPWSDALRRREDPASPPRLRLSKGAHVTVPAVRLPVGRAIAIPVENGRLFFAIPSGPVTLLGTTETDFEGDPDGVAPSPADVAYILARAAEAFPESAPADGDVITAFAGVRPLRFEAGRDASSTSREESIEPSPGAVLVMGGKLTTHRRMAVRAIDAAVRQLSRAGVSAGPSRTASRALPGAPVASRAAAGGTCGISGASRSPEGLALERHLEARYGRRAPAVRELAAEDPAGLRPIVPGLPDVEGEVRFAVREEDARSATDVLVRRTHLYWQAPGQAESALDRVQEILGAELRWTPEAEALSRKAYRDLVEVSRRATGGSLSRT